MAIAIPRRTLAGPVDCTGVGLHSGVEVTVRLEPAVSGSDRRFVRTDLPGSPEIPVHLDHVHETLLSTELATEQASVRTVEHLLAVLAGLGVTDVRIAIDGPELPLLDGSGAEWLAAIAAVGTVEIAGFLPVPMLTEPLTVTEGDAFVTAVPAEETRLSYGIDFDLAPIGNQWFSVRWRPDDWEREVVPARTFGLAPQIEALRQQGLIRGGSLENALVCDHDRWLNPPLRFSNEPVRHKLLDLAGDLSLLGVLPQAHILAYKASHRLHVRFARELQARLTSLASC
ncbi:UDP-3-O-acyl-N-acetylglucosamine deacetylase [Synechococcus elongatus]|uniref:UDP-3-O-acyl-N-acetylglucosamine deacetylase n=1 Tax=Synechococcus elongatus PCC 11801 TaxID=2219813 RepID=A0AAN1QPB5_SYNEL|nr:UDP-3-O-acyl-N-acetylglucosamine deacetylase [Synechococcus elongatus]AZB73062.1 UDP-3-O-[3-hydroxymyristoyl] N-acetylglucosamine deacetylase [Synechococcus elongatus PCC 11801]